MTLDKERGFGSEDLATPPLPAEEIATSIYEFKREPRITPSSPVNGEERHPGHQLPTDAKGLEFSKVILLTDKYLRKPTISLEDERRLFYVAMTRAKEELILMWLSPG